MNVEKPILPGNYPVNMKVKTWIENSCYPGTHWLLYSERGEYVARVDFQPYFNGLYKWVAFMFWDNKRQFGFATSLKSAQKTAQAIVEGKQVQLSLFQEAKK